MMWSMSLMRVFVLVLLLGQGAECSSCNKKPIIFNLGDSNSDTGGAAVLFGKQRLEYGRVFFEYPTGRSCDGRLIVDYLCESLGTKYLSPYLQVSAADYSNGVNFALSGSSAVQTQGAQTLSNQMNQLRFFRNLSDSVPNLDFTSALYMLDIGQNDLASPQSPANIPFSIAKIKEAIKSINQEVGGRKFWVHNTGPLGCVPSKRSNAQSSMDRYGCNGELNAAAAEFNRQLYLLCQELRAETLEVVYIDVFSIKLDIIVNYTSYGFDENPSVPCLFNSSVCPIGSQRVFWDGVHYTQAANSIVAAQIASTRFSTPPLPITFFCD